MEYTKGEWKPTGNFVYCLNKVGTNRFSLLVQGGSTGGQGRTPMSELEANANLIAAVPDMYELLMEIENTELNADILRILQPWFIKVESILVKAEGK